MKKLVSAFLLLVSFSVSAAEFVHPLEFDGSEAQKQQVIEFIKQRVKHDYCNSGVDMCQPATLRMMEQENLKAFKEATQATKPAIMERVIKDYCHSGVDMCNYSTILMMYNENAKASEQKLEW